MIHTQTLYMIVLLKGYINMRQAKFDLGVPLYVNNETELKIRVGFVTGIKQSTRLCKETNKELPIFVYMLSGHGETWFYEDALVKVIK